MKSKRLFLAGLCVWSLQAFAGVDIKPAPQEKIPEYVAELQDGARKTAEEIAAFKSAVDRKIARPMPTNFQQDYVLKQKAGTTSVWKLYDIRQPAAPKLLDTWFARNGKSVQASAIKNADGSGLFAEMPTGARKFIGTKATEHLSADAEMKALERAIRVRQKNGLKPSQVRLEGVVDKAPCASCEMNIRSAEWTSATPGGEDKVGSTLVARDIQVHHLEGQSELDLSRFRKNQISSALGEAGCN